jgi:hypothetical protein
MVTGWPSSLRLAIGPHENAASSGWGAKTWLIAAEDSIGSGRRGPDEPDAAITP